MINPTTTEIEIINSFLSSDASVKNQQWKSLNKYVELLLSENERYNLIGKNTIQTIWSRHIIDSIQLVKYVNDCDCENILDLGSGAGFPIIVLGIITQKHIIMVEKSPVKAQFLEKVCQVLNLTYKIFNESINQDNIKTLIKSKTIITSRAFKSVSFIVDLLQKCNKQNISKILLLKGQKWQEEIDECKNKDKTFVKKWKYQKYDSILNEGVVLEIM